MDKHIFENLAKLEARKRMLEVEIELARHAVMLEMEKHSVDTAKVNEIGTFTLTPVKKWVYSNEVKAAEASVKGLKKVEQDTGLAKVEETLSLRFTPIKNEQSNGDEENKSDIPSE